LTSGTVTLATLATAPRGEAWYHAPATSSDTTWRYEDRLVRAGETLRINARWLAVNAAAVGRVAITHTANWYAGTAGGALAEHVFDGGDTSAWDAARIEWRNDTGEDVQVRVWETVTGNPQGGYLKAWEATGGAM